MLRDYVPSDFDALFALDQQCFVAGIAYTEAELKHYISRRRAFTIVAEDEKRGVAAFWSRTCSAITDGSSPSTPEQTLVARVSALD